jgi:hypothetical protein
MNDYNGWTNRETWLVNLWLDNDQSQRYFIMAAGALSVSDLSAALEDYYASTLPELPAGLYADLLAGAAARINWREIAQKLSDDIKSELGCAKAEANYLATCAQFDAERKAEGRA